MHPKFAPEVSLEVCDELVLGLEVTTNTCLDLVDFDSDVIQVSLGLFKLANLGLDLYNFNLDRPCLVIKVCSELVHPSPCRQASQVNIWHLVLPEVTKAIASVQGSASLVVQSIKQIFTDILLALLQLLHLPLQVRYLMCHL